MQLHLSIQCMSGRLENLDDTKGKSKKDSQHNGQKKKNKHRSTNQYTLI